MNAPGKFIFILMQDDGKAHRLRMGKKLFIVLLCLAVLLPCFGGLGIWVGVKAWAVWQVYEQERTRLQQNLDMWRMQAERYANMLRLAGLEQELNGPVPAVSTAGENSAVPVTAPGVPSVASHVPEIPPPAAPLTPAVQGGSPLPAVSGARQDADATVAAPGSTGLLAATNGTASGSPDASLPAAGPLSSTSSSALSAPSMEAYDAENGLDTGMVRLENVTARVLDNRRLHVTLDLYNTRPNGGPISGKFFMQLIGPSGALLPARHEVGTFRITRYKKVIMQAELPDELAAADNAALLITVTVDEEPVMRKIHPVESR